MELRPIKEIKPNPDNPRVIRDEKFTKLKNSIQDFPEMLKLRPIVVDENDVILGGNQRYRALQELKHKQVWTIKASELTEAQKREFIIKDNVGFGENNWDVLANEWDAAELEAWGLDIPGFDVNSDDLTEDFTLPDGDKEPFQQMTFTLADEQAEVIKNALADMKATDEYKYAETMGNENSNGNALYLIVASWAGQRI